VAQAVAGLAQEGKVICVRLALFAEMMKGKAWTPATLREVGGTEGVGVSFLEETFSAATAPPPHRYHQKAARAVLKALLPEAGTDIKGHMRSHADLLAASGYAGRPRDFEGLLRILDGELRLITPTESEGAEGEDSRGDKRPRLSAESAENQPTSEAAYGYETRQRYYQLTHDYLVHSLRDWLTRKQRETRRGRAELRLAERAALWTVKPERRFLPAWWEWLTIRLLTRPRDWTDPQRRMMRRATRYHGLRLAVLAAVLALIGWAVYEGSGRQTANFLEQRLLNVDTEIVPEVVRELDPWRRWIDPMLARDFENTSSEKIKLRASLGLVPVDPNQVDYLYGRLLTGQPKEVVVIREALQPYEAQLGEKLWQVLEDRGNTPGERLRAACALAGYTTDDRRWEKVSRDVAGELVSQNALVMGQWAEALRPVRRYLLPALSSALLEPGRGAVSCRAIAGICVGYAEEVPDAFAVLEKTLTERSGPKPTEDAKVDLARRQAFAAAALAAVGQWEQVRPLLRHRPDPTARYYLLEQLAPGGVEARAVKEQLDREPEVSVRRALLLSLGNFGPESLSAGEREQLVPPLLALYRDDPDSGMHSAAAWVMREWGQREQLRTIDLASQGPQPPEGGRHWYVNGQGQTMVIVPPPGEFWVGGEDEEPHRRRIDRSFALAARAVTVEEFLRFRKEQEYQKQWAPKPDCPINMVSWYDAVAYCNWLNKQEGIPEAQWCYAPNEKGEYAAGMRVVAGYLGKTGYRLPTEAEREYACRAGSETPWCFGAAQDLVGKYAWFSGNSVGQSHPVGMLRPNELGLYDVHGNVLEWCQDSYVEWPPQIAPASATSTVGFLVMPLGPGVFAGAARGRGWPSLKLSPQASSAIVDKNDVEYIYNRSERLMRGG
jgi:formylglycine-generating enzyme required for sulfatase activity